MSWFNKVILMGNLTRDPEVKHLHGNNCVLNFSIGVNKVWYDNNGDRQERTSFPTCVAWGGTAKFIEKYFSKGSLILIEGELETRSYKDENQKSHYVTQVNVQNAQFAGGSRKSADNYDPPFPTDADMPPEVDTPF